MTLALISLAMLVFGCIIAIIALYDRNKSLHSSLKFSRKYEIDDNQEIINNYKHTLDTIDILYTVLLSIAKEHFADLTEDELKALKIIIGDESYKKWVKDKESRYATNAKEENRDATESANYI